MATKRKLKADGTTGKCAVYIVDDTAIDDSPFTLPLSNLSRVEFHSDLDYLAVSSIQTGTLSLPPRSGTTPGTFRHNLFAHGLGYQPLVLGHLVNFGGYNTPLLGTTPIRTPIDRGVNATADLRTVQLGADSTNVYLHEYVMLLNTSITMPAVSLDWRVMVTTRNMDSSTGNNNTVSHPSNLYISPSRVVFGQGKFDTNRSHIKKVTSGGFPVCVGPSIRIQQQPATDYTINYRYNVNGQSKGSFASISFTASVVLMDVM